MKKSLNFILYTCLGLALFLGVTTAFNKGLSQPDSLKTCFPKEAISYAVLAEYQNYTLILIPNPENTFAPREILIENISQKEQCQWIMGTAEIQRYSMEYYISRQAARGLALDRYKRSLRKFGKDEFQLAFSDEATFEDGDNPIYIFPEDKWALDLLGIKLGSRYKVVDQVPETDAIDPLEYFE